MVHALIFAPYKTFVKMVIAIQRIIDNRLFAGSAIIRQRLKSPHIFLHRENY
jgi:hypothetical protein